MNPKTEALKQALINEAFMEEPVAELVAKRLKAEVRLMRMSPEMIKRSLKYSSFKAWYPTEEDFEMIFDDIQMFIDSKKKAIEPPTPEQVDKNEAALNKKFDKMCESELDELKRIEKDIAIKIKESNNPLDAIKSAIDNFEVHGLEAGYSRFDIPFQSKLKNKSDYLVELHKYSIEKNLRALPIYFKQGEENTELIKMHNEIIVQIRINIKKVIDKPNPNSLTFVDFNRFTGLLMTLKRIFNDEINKLVPDEGTNVYLQNQLDKKYKTEFKDENMSEIYLFDMFLFTACEFDDSNTTIVREQILKNEFYHGKK